MQVPRAQNAHVYNKMGNDTKVALALWSALPYDVALIVALKPFRTWFDVRDKAKQS